MYSTTHSVGFAEKSLLLAGEQTFALDGLIPYDGDGNVLPSGTMVVTSSEGLRNLHDMLGAAGRHFLEPTPLFVPHPRIAATARELGLPSVVLAQPLDAGIVATLVQHFAASG